MAALEASPFEDLLASHSVFVSPLTAGADRYGHQPDDPYDLGADVQESESTEPCVFRGDTQWQWEGRSDPAATDHLEEEEYVDFEDEVAEQPPRQQGRGAAPPGRPPKEEANFVWDDFEDDREDGVEMEEGIAGDDVEDDVRFDEVGSTNNSTNSKDMRKITEDAGDRREAYKDNLDQHVSPSSMPPPQASPSGSRSLEDQPIRGLAVGREMSLDELIAQGERQMLEAQAKTAAATRRAPAGGSGAGGGSIKSATTTSREPGGVAIASPAIQEQQSLGGEIGGGVDDAFGARPRRSRVRHSAEFRDTSPGAGAKSGSRSSLESTADRGGDRVGGGGEGSGVRGSVSARNASFATSWSGGDAEQELRHLSSLSMGVTPAAGVGGPVEQTEAESRSERERREFYELEMELLREEKGTGGAGGHRPSQCANPGGEEPEDGDDFWDDEGESYDAGGGNGRVGKGDLAGGLGFRSAVASERGDAERGLERDRAHSSGTETYRQFAGKVSGEAEVADEIHTASPKPSRGNRQIEASASGVRGEGGALAGREGEDRRQERSDYNDFYDDDATRRWEAGDDGESEGRGRTEWGQSTRRNDARATRNPPSRSQGPYAVQEDGVTAGGPAANSVHSRSEASTTVGRRASFHSANTIAPPVAAGPESSKHRPSALEEDDAFDDDRAWGEAGTELAADKPNPIARYDRSRSAGGQVVGPPTPRSRPRPGPRGPAPPRDEGLQDPPAQSKLVQRVFGARGSGGRSAGTSDRGRRGGRGSGPKGRGVGEDQGKGGGESWAVQAGLEGKLRELEEEIARYKEENERARLSRRKQESVLAEVMRKRQEVRQWAEAEREAVETWCTEQRQAAAREKRAAMKQIQGLRARAQAGGASGAGTATERRQRQEIEALRATIERGKLDAEAARKKARASERRLHQQIKSGAERIVELEGQVSFLERQRIDVWASNTAGAGLGAGRRLQKQGGKVGLSASAGRTDAGVGRGVLTTRVDASASEGSRAECATRFSSTHEDNEDCWEDRTMTTRRREGARLSSSGNGKSDGVSCRYGGEMIAGEGSGVTGAGGESEENRGDAVRHRILTRHSEERGWTSANVDQDPAATRRNSTDVSGRQYLWAQGVDTDAKESRNERSRLETERPRWEGSGMVSGRWQTGDECGDFDDDGERSDSRTYPNLRLGAGARAAVSGPAFSAAPATPGGARYEEKEHFSPSGVRGRRSPSLLVPPQLANADDRIRDFSSDTGIRAQNDVFSEVSTGAGVKNGAWEPPWDGRATSLGGVIYDPVRYETAAGGRQRESRDGNPPAAQATAVGERSESGRPARSPTIQTTVPRSPVSRTERVAAGGGHGRAHVRNARDSGGDELNDVGRHQPAQLSPVGQLNAGGTAPDGRFRRDPWHRRETGVATAEVGEAGTSPRGGGRKDARGSLGGGGEGKVEHVLRDGRRIVLFANGTQKETLSDGGCVVRFMNGDLKRVEGRTGVVVYTYTAARTTHTMHPSGLEVFEFPNGQVERHHKSGEKNIEFPDGTRKAILPCGREISEFPDGVTVVEYPEGYRDVMSPHGTSHRELSDGTVASLPGSPETARGSAGFASKGFWSQRGAGGSASNGGSRASRAVAAASERGQW